MFKNFSKSKNVVIVANCTWYLYNFRRDLLKELNDKGYNLILISTIDIYHKQISKYFIKTNKLFLLRGSENLLFEAFTIFNLFYLYIKYRPIIVHHFTIKPSIYGGIISRLLGIKYVINHITGLGPSFFNKRRKIKLLNKIFKPFYFYSFNNKKAINIFHNEDDKNTFVDRKLSIIQNNIVIKGSGVDTDYFKSNCVKKDFNKDINILFPARIIKEKGILELISACEDLWKKDYKFVLNIAGEIDKSNKSSLKECNLDPLHKNKNINLIGKRNDMRNVYNKTDIVILPSWREGLSKSLLEASSMALPIITCDVPGCRDVIKNKYSGLLVPVRDKDKLKLAIKNYIDNPSIAISYGLNARKSTVKNYTTNKINDQILKIYKNFTS